eukprot:snap_masked-scaffold_3-processed-gene-21.27-mRNA-1 protein AED:1.00 eAED:1.00 QI:0/0/0/0/1/1/2/0/61
MRQWMFLNINLLHVKILWHKSLKKNKFYSKIIYIQPKNIILIPFLFLFLNIHSVTKFYLTN